MHEYRGRQDRTAHLVEQLTMRNPLEVGVDEGKQIARDIRIALITLAHQTIGKIAGIDIHQPFSLACRAE
jgi:hypothetical protein